MALFLAVAPVGCGVFNGYKKNSEGFYEKHYNCCGPIALEKALNSFWAKPHDGVIYCFIKPFDREELSQQIQKEGMARKEALSFFHRDAICITWPSEIKRVLKKYNVETVKVDRLDDLDLNKDVAIVLVHGAFFSRQYHWVVFPLDNVKNYYGDDTVIDVIYLLKIQK